MGLFSRVDSRQPRSSTISQPKNTIGQTIKMDLGLAPKNESYYAGLSGRQARSRAMAESSSSNKSDGGSGSAAPKKLTAAELRAQKKAADLARRKTEGQAARKKFEEKKGKSRIALRKRYMKLLNV